MPSKFLKVEISIRRVAFILLAIIGIAAAMYQTHPPAVVEVVHNMQGKKAVDDRLEEYRDDVLKRLVPSFHNRGIEYPPRRLVFVGLKEEKVLQVYADEGDDKYQFVKSYPILAASGRIGPKLREGDCQVPEGIYTVVFLNPNSLYHLSLRLNYPNEFDQKMAEKEGRIEPGKDIMIHGSASSVGCLAMGDPASEDLFVLAAETGIENIKVVLSPVDFRKRKLDTRKLDLPDWTDGLYQKISKELSKLPEPDETM